MSGDFATGLELFADVLLNPVFPEAALEREREIQLAYIKAQKDQLLKSAGIAMRRAMFGDAGYGLDSLGNENSVSRLQVAQLQAFHKAVHGAEQLRAGHLWRRQRPPVKAAVEKAFGQWKAGADALTHLPKTIPLHEIKRVSEIRDKKQAVLLIGFPGTTVQSADRYALELLQEACSDLGSRLFLRIREKLGLAYYVGAQNFWDWRRAIFHFTSAPRRKSSS